MTKDEFYRGKVVVDTEWWLDDRVFPELAWARLRELDDGTADACWVEGGHLFGYRNAECACLDLADGNYRRFIDAQDSYHNKAYGIAPAKISTPEWEDDPDAYFEYLDLD